MDWMGTAVATAGAAMLLGTGVIGFGVGRAWLAATADRQADLMREIPGFRAETCEVAQTGTTALVQNTYDGAIYLAVGRGKELTTRKLVRGLVRNVVREGRDLKVKLADFALPLAMLTLPDEASAAGWEERLSELQA